MFKLRKLRLFRIPSRETRGKSERNQKYFYFLWKNDPPLYAKSQTLFCTYSQSKQYFHPRIFQSIYLFIKNIEKFMKHMYSMSDLRKLWLEDSNKHAKLTRMISMNFLRKHSFQYIFNSRIKIYDRNLKYRRRIIQGVQNPQSFSILKDF